MARDGSDWDWAGALIIAEHIDDTRFMRNFAEAYAGAMKKAGRRGRRR